MRMMIDDNLIDDVVEGELFVFGDCDDLFGCVDLGDDSVEVVCVLDGSCDG